MRLEDIAYSFFGNNLVIGAHIRKQLDFLEAVLPDCFRGWEMDDLGCGDGKVTVLLEKIFRPARLRGFDINSGLVRRAWGRGVDARVMDLDKALPGGELAVLWGVLHHLRDFESCLCRLKDSYPLLFIREPVKTGIVGGLELGHPLRFKELLTLMERRLPGCRIHCCEGSILVLYSCPDLLEERQTIPASVESLLSQRAAVEISA